jgi:hypothetical protein
MARTAANTAALRLLPGGHGKVKPAPRCELATQAVMAGIQDIRVAGQNAQNTGKGHGVISIRVGTVLVYLEDRDALNSWIAAVQRAAELQDSAYGPQHPLDRYEPRSKPA